MAGWRNPAVHAAVVEPQADRPGFAISLMLFAFFCFTCLDSSAKWLVTSGMPTWAAVFSRYAVHLAVVLVVILAAGPPKGLLRTRALGKELLRASCLLASTALNFAAVKSLPLTLTSTIMFSMPMIVTVLSIPMLGEKVGIRRWVAIMVGFCGIIIVTRPWTAEFEPAMLFSLGAATCGSLYQILTRQLAGVDSTNTQQLYAGLVATVGVAPIAFMDWAWPTDQVGWVLLCLLGVFGFMGHQALTVAHRYAPASVLAPFVYFQLVFMAASSWIVFSQPPTVWIYAGAPVIMGSGFYIWWRERQIRG